MSLHGLLPVEGRPSWLGVYIPGKRHYTGQGGHDQRHQGRHVSTAGPAVFTPARSTRKRTDNDRVDVSPEAAQPDDARAPGGGGGGGTLGRAVWADAGP